MPTNSVAPSSFSQPPPALINLPLILSFRHSAGVPTVVLVSFGARKPLPSSYCRTLLLLLATGFKLCLFVSLSPISGPSTELLKKVA